MTQYTVIGLDLAKRKFHLVGMNEAKKGVYKLGISREDFFLRLPILFPTPQTFAFEACGGAHYTAQQLQAWGHKVIMLKPKDVKAYAKSRQKNDMNDALAICKASSDPELKTVHQKSKEEQVVAYLHKARQNVI